MAGERAAPALAAWTSGLGPPGVSEDPAENLRRVSFAMEGADYDPALSPDGTRLYFASTAHRLRPDIYVKAVDGRALTQLTNHPASDAMPAISPDGRRLAFASDRAGSWDIYIMNASGGQPVQITADSSADLHPTWSPDGRHIAYCKLGDVSREWEIWVTAVDRPGVHQFLTRGMFPDWHPTEGRIAFQRARERSGRLFSIWTLAYRDGEATELTEVASHPSFALVNPKWARDGECLAFTAAPPDAAWAPDFRPRAGDVWILHVSSGATASLTGGRHLNFMPAWGPANTVYFVSDRGGNRNIWARSASDVIAAMGTPAASLTAWTMPAGVANANRMPMGRGRFGLPSMTMVGGRSVPPGATFAPAQTSQDSPPEIANVPIHD